MPLLTVARAVTAATALALTPVIGGALTHQTAAATAVSPVADARPVAPAAATTSAAGPAATPGLSQECSSVGARIDRIQRLQTRLHAGATTRGSLAHLSARIDRAKAAGHADLAKVLSDRLAIRKDVDARLPDMLTHLKDAQQVCAR